MNGNKVVTFIRQYEKYATLFIIAQALQGLYFVITQPLLLASKALT